MRTFNIYHFAFYILHSAHYWFWHNPFHGFQGYINYLIKICRWVSQEHNRSERCTIYLFHLKFYIFIFAFYILHFAFYIDTWRCLDDIFTLWNMVEIVKFGWNCEIGWNCKIWLKLWNLIEIVIFGWNCEIRLKLWN